MATSLKKRNAKRNKYVVNFVPSSSLNRRLLVFLLTAVAMVTLAVLLATLIPIYMTGSGDDKNNEHVLEGQEGDNSLANSRSRSAVIGLSTTQQHHWSGSSVNIRLSATPAATSFGRGAISSAVKAALSTRITSSSFIKEPSVISFSSMNSGDFMISTASKTASAVSKLASLVPNTETKWSRWSPWSDCTKTCGTGARHRNRTCVAQNQGAVFAPIACAGKHIQNKTCAEWNCTDCNRTCVKGTLNDECSACTCDDHVLTGRVLSETNVPLSEANISLAETPYRVLAQTNISGFFTAFNVCTDAEQELFITKVGFVPTKKNATVLTPSTANVVARLEFAVPPFVTVHPESKIRMPGQSVTFCCEGEGNPPPEIEWFKENNIIDKDLYSYDNTLVIPTVPSGLSGTYRCRVVNDFGSEFSDRAVLTVLEKSEDSCFSTPSSKNETLPAGCVLNGTNTTTVDVGECEPVKCVKGNTSFNSACTEPSLCCGPRSFESVLVQCGALMSFNLSVIKACGCGKCIEKQTVIEGQVLGQDDSAATFVDLFFAGTLVDRTDKDGMFSFVVPKATKRVIVTFKDRVSKNYQEQDKIFTINEGQRTMYRVKLRKKAIPITFNASEPLELPLGGVADSFADVELPENALLTEDGSVFSGNAKVTVSVTDPRNQSDILSAPGDFTTVNEDGEVEMLETYGMIKLNLEDDNGKPLAMSKPMKVYLDPEKLNITVSDGNASVKLYWLDRKTGRWRETGDFFPQNGSKRRGKRSNRIFLAGTVTQSIAQENLNFDWPSMIVGLRVATNPVEDGVIITAIRKDHKGYVKRNTKHGVICMPIWKDKEYYLQAEKNFRYYDPDPALRDFNTTFRHVKGGVKEVKGAGKTISLFEFYSGLVNQTGPIYYDDRPGGRERSMCEQSLNSAQPQPKGSQFVFKQPHTTPEEYALLSTPADLSEWLSSQGGETCFIKVTITGRSVLFMAASYKKDDQSQIGEYGFHLRMPRVATSGSDNKVVCLQFRCPRANDHTVLVLTPITSEATCVLKQTDSDLVSPQSSSQKCPGSLPPTKGQEKWLCIPWSDSELYSTYKGLDNNGEVRCLRSNQRYHGTDTTTEVLATEFSVKYDCRSNDDSFKGTIRIYNWPRIRDKCYVKVLVIGRRSLFKVESYRTDQNGLFGYSTDITRPTIFNSSLSAACLEYRCAQPPENAYIVVRPAPAGCRFYKAASGLRPYQNRLCGSRQFPILQGEERSICDDRPFYHNGIDGLYKPWYGSFGTAQGSCRAGLRPFRFIGSMFSRGYALYYDCRY